MGKGNRTMADEIRDSIPQWTATPNREPLPELKASDYTHLSSINETPNQVLGEHLVALETYQDFSDKGTIVRGGNAVQRNWTDKSFVPITLATQCIDCLHCVVACPHHSIH